MAGNVQALVACFKGVSSCTASGVDADWSATGTTSVIGPTLNRTITVPSGNSGTLKFSITVDVGASTKYSKNGGAFTTFVQNDTVVFANGDTLKFEMTGSSSGVTASGNVIDNTTAATVGAVSLTNTS